MADYYQVLGISEGAGLSEIRKAFRHKALKLHPDQGGDEKAFRELKEAFEYLLANVSAAREEIGYNPHYDPFTDPDYFKREFFAPENDKMAEFERSVRAQGCTLCNGLGTISRLVDPSKGFMGREERFCRCQIIK